jgi:hypothetical protein
LAAINPCQSRHKGETAITYVARSGLCLFSVLFFPVGSLFDGPSFREQWPVFSGTVQQTPRSCRPWEFSRSSAQENEQRKKQHAQNLESLGTDSSRQERALLDWNNSVREIMLSGVSSNGLGDVRQQLRSSSPLGKD